MRLVLGTRLGQFCNLFHHRALGGADLCQGDHDGRHISRLLGDLLIQRLDVAFDDVTDDFILELAQGFRVVIISEVNRFRYP